VNIIELLPQEYRGESFIGVRPIDAPLHFSLLVLPFNMLVSTWVGAESQDSARPLKFKDVYNGCFKLIELKSIVLLRKLLDYDFDVLLLCDG
jgi:hypothetical protein